MPRVTDKTAGNIHPEIQRLEDSDWGLIRDLLAGTKQMRENRIHKDDQETDRSFYNRRESAFLFEQYRDALDQAAARPFTRPVVVNELDSASEEVQAFLENVDLEGNGINTFAHMWLKDAIRWGKSYVLVDAPSFRARNAQEERALGIRPYWKMIPGPDLVDWEEERAPNGERRDRWFKYRSDFMERGEDGELEPVECMRVLYLRYQDDAEVLDDTPRGTWEKWARRKGGNWEIDAEGQHEFVGSPLVELNLDPSGRHLAMPVYRDLAWTNLEHFWLTMLVNYNLYFSAFAFIAMYGFSPETVKAKLRIGPHQVHASKDTSARAEFVEPAGTAAAALEKARSSNEQRAQVQGVRPFIEKPGTATGDAIREGRDQCDAQTWVHLAEVELLRAMEIVVQRMSSNGAAQPLPDDFSFDIHDEFSEVLSSGSQLEELRQAATASPPLLSPETYLVMAKKHRLLSERLDVEEELRRIQLTLEARAEREAAAFPLPPEVPDREDDDEGDEGDGGDDEDGAESAA